MLSYSFSIIGAGNMAFRLSLGLFEAGHTIDYIYNRTEKNGEKLVKALHANKSEAQFTSNLRQLLSSQIVIIAVSDNAIEEVVSSLSSALCEQSTEHTPLFFHTSGATDISVLTPLEDLNCHIGVLYPLMTMSKIKALDFKDVPFLFEAESDEVKQVQKNIAYSLRSEYRFCDSQSRLRMHCAAVFTCNFINYILGLGFDIADGDRMFLLPTTIEMVRKSFIRTPADMQTGPALRGDTKTMEKHIKLLEELNLPEHETIYKIISENIAKNKK